MSEIQESQRYEVVMALSTDHKHTVTKLVGAPDRDTAILRAGLVVYANGQYPVEVIAVRAESEFAAECPLNHDPLSFAKGEYSGPPKGFTCECNDPVELPDEL